MKAHLAHKVGFRDLLEVPELSVTASKQRYELAHMSQWVTQMGASIRLRLV